MIFYKFVKVVLLILVVSLSFITAGVTANGNEKAGVVDLILTIALTVALVYLTTFGIT